MNIKRRTATLGMMALGGTALGVGRARAESENQAGLYDAAKKEGQLTWYSGILNQPICESVGSAFTRKYPGIHVNAIKTTSEVAFQRVMQDQNGGSVQADVFTTTDASHMSYLISKNLLVKFTPDNAKGLAPALRAFNGGGYYTVSWVGLLVLMYNTRKVKPADAPKDWPDLLDPKWKNQVAVGSPNYSGLIAVWTVAMNQKYGWQYFEKLNALSPLIGRSADDPVTVLNSGERMVAPGNPASALRSAAKGNPLAINYPTSFTLADPSPSGILKGSHSPSAAKLFVEFLAGPEYSTILAENFEQPLRPDVAPHPGEKALADMTVFIPTLADIEKELPGLKAKWRDTFGM